MNATYSHPQSNRSVLRSNDWLGDRPVRRRQTDVPQQTTRALSGPISFTQTAVLLSLSGLVCSFAVAPGIASAAGRGACAQADRHLVHVDKDAPRAGSLATIAQGDGTCIRFYEVEPGEIMVTGHGPKGTLPPSARFHDLKNMDMIDLYETLTDGEAAPAPLVDAQRRVDESPDLVQDPRDEPLSQSGEKRGPRAIPNLSASDFQSTYCDFAYDFTYCNTNRTGDSSIEEHATLAEVYANPYRGNIHLQLEYHNLLGWHDNGHTTVSQGNVYWMLAFGSRKDRRGNVHQAAGDGYHWVFQGVN